MTTNAISLLSHFGKVLGSIFGSFDMQIDHNFLISSGYSPIKNLSSSCLLVFAVGRMEIKLAEKKPFVSKRLRKRAMLLSTTLADTWIANSHYWRVTRRRDNDTQQVGRDCYLNNPWSSLSPIHSPSWQNDFVKQNIIENLITFFDTFTNTLTVRTLNLESLMTTTESGSEIMRYRLTSLEYQISNHEARAMHLNLKFRGITEYFQSNESCSSL